MPTSLFSLPSIIAFSSSVCLRRPFIAFIVLVSLVFIGSSLHRLSTGVSSSPSEDSVLPPYDDDFIPMVSPPFLSPMTNSSSPSEDSVLPPYDDDDSSSPSELIVSPLQRPSTDDSSSPFEVFASPPSCGAHNNLEKVLNHAATDDNTVIITTLNDAWSAPGSIFDLFLESFRIGNQTEILLKHLVVVALDEKAFTRCKGLGQKHCYNLATKGVDFSKEAVFMQPDYLQMMWRRINFLRYVLELGYNFVFTDTDVMWFRNPFPRFYPDVDFQIACDHFLGNSFNLSNMPNGGFTYVRSNNRSVSFYRFWYSSRNKHPGLHDQDVLNLIKDDPFIKEEIGLTIRFLDTAYFGGLCEPSKDFNLVCTMHVNCCVGMDNKINDLKIMLQDWEKYMSLPPSFKISSAHSWGVPKRCSPP